MYSFENEISWLEGDNWDIWKNNFNCLAAAYKIV